MMEVFGYVMYAIMSAIAGGVGFTYMFSDFVQDSIFGPSGGGFDDFMGVFASFFIGAGLTTVFNYYVVF